MDALDFTPHQTPVDMRDVERELVTQRRAREQSLADAEKQLMALEERTATADQRARAAEEKRHRARQSEDEATVAESSRSGPPPTSTTPVPPADEAGCPNSSSAERPGVAGTVPADPYHPEGKAAEEDALDLNEADFERLRKEGMSVKQATRFVSHRERLGGFESVDDLDGIEFLPYDLHLQLKD